MDKKGAIKATDDMIDSLTFDFDYSQFMNQSNCTIE